MNTPAHTTSASTRTTETVRLALLGNLLITSSKFAAFSISGSSALLSESIHSLVDSGNQALLLIGLRDVGRLNDARHPYGYGKSIYFWSLVSALGTFWLGAGVSMTHSVQNLINPGLEEVTWHVWGVLGVSLAVDGWVLNKVVRQVMEDKPSDVTYFQHMKSIRDPATLAVLLEDGAACTGVLVAGVGISASHFTGNPVWDGMAGVGVSCLLAGMGLTLARLNQRFLLGQAVDNDIVKSINNIISSRSSIDSVASVQSQWTGPYSFSYKAEIDVDGTFLAAKLMDRYQKEFLSALNKNRLEKDLKFLLSLYAEDVMRAVESEIKDIEAEIRLVHPEAAYIELEPDSRTSAVFAIDQATEDVLEVRTREIKQLARMMKTLKEEKEASPNSDLTSPFSSEDEYEQLRADKIKRNEAFFESLKRQAKEDDTTFTNK
ncbi:hypothetical protein TrVE_jg14470 [Triparma verrucosa]|uniref:Cation efflux protein transmembrane domain-containing protein n=1 Tax=Triparma verrucosa TaxID=1606542 RepID=A0A9W6ZA99_9STRA|nr:hypothetical protein TrVE_jg14470 [Triparma verrucosa]